MAFKKLHPLLKEAMEHLNIETPTPFQEKAISKIKSGANFFGFAKKESGKTTTLIINTLHKLKCEEVGNAPRAIIIVQSKEEAQDLHAKFMEYTKHMNMRVYMAYEKLHIDIQKSEIFMGIDVLISTPKNLHQLFLFNGVNFSQLKLFAIDDADLLAQRGELAAINNLSESIKKCQYVVLAEKTSPKLERLRDQFMFNASTVNI